MKTKNNIIQLFDIDINNLSFKEALDNIISFVEGNHKGYIVTANVDHILRLKEDTIFRASYDNSLLVLADGMPLIIASKLLRKPLKERITGADLFPAIASISADKGFSLFLLGGLQDIPEKASEKLKSKYPALKIAGIYSPPFGFEKSDEEREKIIRMINDVSPDILFIGVGAPKQEKWIYENIDSLNIKVALCVGAAFDFVAGKVKRAPKIMQKLSLEWMWRLLHEPKRLWRRYILYDFRFFPMFVKEFLKKK